MALVVAAVDGLEAINDSYGHEEVDQLLSDVAIRMKGALGANETLARLQGARFALVCEELAEPYDALAAAQRVREAVEGSFRIGVTETFVTMSFGIAFLTDPEGGAEILIRDANAALNAAGKRGRGELEIFSGDLRTEVVGRLSIESDLRRAVERSELELLYQPVVHLGTGDPLFIEALLTWRHPSEGLLEDAEFMPLAKTAGLVGAIYQWTLGQVCRQAVAWERSTNRKVRMSVNILSPSEVGDEDLAVSVSSALADAQLEPDRLYLEMPVHVLSEKNGDSGEIVRSLHDRGVRIIVSGAGRDFESLRHIGKLPVDLLKIDEDFVAGLGKRPEDYIVIEAIIRVAQMVSSEAVAVGVETEEQLSALKKLGCNLAQGPLFSEAVDAASIEKLFKQRKRKWGF